MEVFGYVVIFWICVSLVCIVLFVLRRFFGLNLYLGISLMELGLGCISMLLFVMVEMICRMCEFESGFLFVVCSFRLRK